MVEKFGDGNFCVRVVIANALGKIGHSYAVEHLIEYLDPDKEPHMFVRAAVAEALGKIKDKQAFTPLLEGLKREGGVVLLAIAEALGNFDDKRAVEPLIKSLGTSRNVNKEAAISLEKLSRYVTNEHILDMLYMLKNGHTYQLRAGCALAIGEIGRDGTLNYLKEAAMNDTSMSVRWAVAKTLRKAKNKREALPILLKLLHDTKKSVRETASESILELTSDTDSSTVKQLLSVALIALDDKERESAVREAAEKYLKLAEHLKTDEEKEREAEIAEISSFFDCELKKMEEIADIKEILERIETLEDKGGEDAVESLMEFLENKDERVRKAASEALERLLEKANSPEVDAALKDDSCEETITRIKNAAKKYMGDAKTMMFDGKVFSREHSPPAPQKSKQDTPKGSIKKTLM